MILENNIFVEALCSYGTRAKGRNLMPIYYKIRVQNHLPALRAEWFEGAAITHHANGEATLSGPFRDQAALFGTLDKLRDLNLTLIAVQRLEPGHTSTEENKAIVQSYMAEILSGGNLAVAGNYFSEEVAFNGGQPSKEIVAVMFRLFRTAFPDLQVTIEDQIAAGDKVATRVTFQGTHLGPIWDILPSGRRVTFSGIALDRIAGGKIVEMWHEADFMTLRMQLRDNVEGERVT
jgi:predicted ester cyclase